MGYLSDAYEGINTLSRYAYQTAMDHGFHNTPNPLPQSLCLIHSEVSEALEAYRDNVIEAYREADGKPEGVLSELADVIIRVLDTAEELAPGRLSVVLAAKMRYNDGRPVGHGRVRL